MGLRAVLLLLLVLAVVCWLCGGFYVQIETYAGQTRLPSRTRFGVFGAAEYDGRPSRLPRPLDHALACTRGICSAHHHLGAQAETILRGAVGREYLMAWRPKKPSLPRRRAAIPRSQRAALL